MHTAQPDDDTRVTYFAATHTRGKRDMFGIRAIDRGKHVYVIGKTGMGKSTMLENMAIQDIQNGEGIAFIDPHGSTAEKLLDFVPRERIKVHALWAATALRLGANGAALEPLRRLRDVYPFGTWAAGHLDRMEE